MVFEPVLSEVDVVVVDVPVLPVVVLVPGVVIVVVVDVATCVGFELNPLQPAIDTMPTNTRVRIICFL